MKKRVVVTGMGAITPIGIGVDAFWDGICNEKIGFGPITQFDATDYKCKLAAEVKDFDPEQFMDKKSARRMERFCQFAVAASGEAIKDAGLDLEKEDPYRIAVSIVLVVYRQRKESIPDCWKKDPLKLDLYWFRS